MHGDFHPGNILLQSDGSAVVIDWTGFDVSDYRFDLARTLLISLLNMPDGWTDVIRAYYEQARGKRTDHLEYFEVIAAIDKLANMLVTLGRHGTTTTGLNPEMLKQYRGQTWELGSFLQEKIEHSLPDLEREIRCVNEQYA
jgi:aminoglycoside phosphotransferase (APT) family kinase protein